MASKVFVGNLAFGATREEVESLFSQVGSVVDCFLPVDRASGRARGFAFVEFATEEEAAEAISRFDGYDLNGRSLRVNAAEDRPRGAGRPPMGMPPDFSGGGGGFGGGGGGFGGGGGGRFNRAKPKGSRRNIRARKRGL